MTLGDPRLPERFWAKVRVDDAGCWSWQGCDNGVGYGQIRWHNKQRYAHRIAYEHLIGSVPPGLDLDHLCRNRGCCNPAHLEPVTRSVNLRRGTRSQPKDACKRGHALVGHNAKIDKSGVVRCRACSNAAARERTAS